MKDDSFNDPMFLDQLRTGDQGAYRRLIRRFHGSLVGVASGILGSRAQAEEVVQDTWLAVFSSIARFEGRSSLASWLFTITLNRARTRVGRESRMVPFSSFTESADGEERAVPLDRFIPDGHWAEKPALWDELDPERVVGGRQLWDIVQDVIQAMPASQRAVIVMRDIEDVDAEQVCAMLEISPENQRVLLHRARGRVRAAIDAAIAKPASAHSGAAGARQGAVRRGVERVGQWLLPSWLRGGGWVWG
jgi:RNA polymerase sigma-70 factor (ECF subfamily)